MALKTLLLSALFLCGNGDLFADTTPASYSDAQDQLAWLSLEATVTHKALKEKIKEQSADYETLNRLRQAKISVEEMIQRDNVAKACKVVDLGFTAAGVVTGGAAVAAKEGGKAAFNWIAGKIAVEGAKEAAGVPGYSDAVKVGAYILNKAGQDELAGQLSKDNIEVLTRAQQLIQDDSDDKTLKDKLPELRQMIFDMESAREKNDYQLKYLSTKMDELKKKGDLLNSAAKTLKEKEAKEAEKAVEKSKKAEPPLLNTELFRPAEVPPAAVGPKDTPEERKRKIQESIDRYISSLRAKIAGEKKTADAAWAALKKPEGNVRYARNDGTDQVKDLFYSLNYLEGGFTETRTYVNMQSIEASAKSEADFLSRYREQLENHRSEIRSKIEPIITDISGYTGQWKSVRDTYGPQGYFVSDPEKVREMTPWTDYYEMPLKFIDGYLKATEGLEPRFRAIEAKAAAQKNAIYAEAKELLAAYTAKLQDFRDYKPQTVAQLEKIGAELSKKADTVSTLPSDFVSEFSYNGKHDLADLEAKVTAAKSAFSAMQGLSRAGTLLACDLEARYRELGEMAGSALMNEARTISYMAENRTHKEAMAAALKRTADYAPEMRGAESSQYLASAVSNAAATMFGAEDALKFLQSRSAQLVAVYGKAAAALKNDLSKDLSYLEKTEPGRYGAEIQKLFEPARRAEAEMGKIIEEVLKAPLFGDKPLLERVGFWTAQAEAGRAGLEKITAAFWDSPQGKRIAEARRIGELQVSRETSDPGLAAVRRLYEGFESAYESRNAAKLMSFISEDWSAGDGTTASDLNEQFTRIFRLFDEISVDITGLQVAGEGKNMYTASYNMMIRSRIYKKNIKREESSSVYEHIEVNGTAARIKRTEAGGYWDIK